MQEIEQDPLETHSTSMMPRAPPREVTKMLAPKCAGTHSPSEEPSHLEIELAVGSISHAAAHHDGSQEGLHQDGSGNVVGSRDSGLGSKRFR